jgi:GTP-binding protein
LDEQMMKEMEALLPKGIPFIFISSISGMNIDRLKDMIWAQINE